MKPITVKELIGVLNTLDQDTLVALSCDSEGNSFSLVPEDDFCSSGYLKNCLGQQDIYYDDEDISKSSFLQEKIESKELKRTIILWPSN